MLFAQLLEYQDVVVGLSARQWLGVLLSVPAAYLAGMLLERLLVGVGKSLAQRTASPWDDELVRLLPGPARLTLSLLIFLVCSPMG